MFHGRRTSGRLRPATATAAGCWRGRRRLTISPKTLKSHLATPGTAGHRLERRDVTSTIAKRNAPHIAKPLPTRRENRKSAQKAGWFLLRSFSGPNHPDGKRKARPNFPGDKRRSSAYRENPDAPRNNKAVRHVHSSLRNGGKKVAHRDLRPLFPIPHSDGRSFAPTTPCIYPSLYTPFRGTQDSTRRGTGVAGYKPRRARLWCGKEHHVHGRWVYELLTDRPHQHAGKGHSPGYTSLFVNPCFFFPHDAN